MNVNNNFAAGAHGGLDDIIFNAFTGQVGSFIKQGISQLTNPKKESKGAALKRKKILEKNLFDPIKLITDSQKSAKTMSDHNNGDEVPVSKVPRNIAKTVPTTFNIVLPYADQWIIDSTNSHASSKIVYKTNDPVDPLHSAPRETGTHQPMGWDKYVTIWQYYRVIASRWKVSCINLSDKTVVGGFYWNDDASDGITTVTSLMESKYSGHRIMPAPVSSNASSLCNFTYHYSPSTLVHHVRNVDTEDRWTQVTSSPSIPHYFQIQFYQWRDQDTANFDIQVVVEAEYTIQFKESDPSIYWDADDTIGQTAPDP